MGLRPSLPHHESMSFWPKCCSVCTTKYAAVDWKVLAYVGDQEDGEGSYLEMRNCACKTTLVVPAKRLG